MNIQSKTQALIKSGGLFLLLGCPAWQGQAAANTPSFGYLQVFSATQESQWGEGSYYYLHTGYHLYDARGKEMKWIENHDTSIDETPQKIELAPGSYSVSAESDHGLVKVPVVVKVARTTSVHIDDLKKISDLGNKSAGVRVEHGEGHAGFHSKPKTRRKSYEQQRYHSAQRRARWN